MEFVGFGDVRNELRSRGVVESQRSDGSIRLSIDAAKHPTSVLLASPPAAASTAGCHRVGHCVECPAERAAAALETVLHKLHLAPLYIIPVGTWRPIFDVVSFDLASNEAWQEIDSQASIQQNTRDPLVCGPRDLHTLRELVRVLLANGEPDCLQALSVVATGHSIVAQIEAKRPIQIELANAQVAEQARDAAMHFLNGSQHA